MRVGVYDALCVGEEPAGGAGSDIKGLATTLVSDRKNWPGAVIQGVTYCTARVDVSNPSAHYDQVIYLRALDATKRADTLHFGRYVTRLEYRPLAFLDRRNKLQLARPALSPEVKRILGVRPSSASGRVVMVPIAHTEEKGSDVNVACHLLLDALRGAIDAAVVITNDSDLELPIKEARELIPVGTVNPTSGQIAGALRGSASDGVVRHFWRHLTADDFIQHQLPNPAGGYYKPAGW